MLFRNVSLLIWICLNSIPICYGDICACVAIHRIYCSQLVLAMFSVTYVLKLVHLKMSVGRFVFETANVVTIKDIELQRVTKNSNSKTLYIICN